MWKMVSPIKSKGELFMAKLTKEQYLEKIDSLNEKYERIESRYIKN